MEGRKPASSCAARVADGHGNSSSPGYQLESFSIVHSEKCDRFLDPISLFPMYLWSSLTLLQHILKQVLRKSTKEKNSLRTLTSGNANTQWLAGRVFCAQNVLLPTLKLSSIAFLSRPWLGKGCLCSGTWKLAWCSLLNPSGISPHSLRSWMPQS